MLSPDDAHSEAHLAADVGFTPARRKLVDVGEARTGGSMSDASERRRFDRIRLDGRMAGRATVLADFRVVALSETGASIEMEIPLAEGSRCDLTLNLSHVSVELKGRVVNLRASNGPQGPYLVGVDFEGMEDMDRALLLSFLDRERRRTP